MGDEDLEPYLTDIQQRYIQPELNRRKAEGTLSSDFHIWQCLVCFPIDEPVIVTFNEEIPSPIPAPVLPPHILENTQILGSTAYVYMSWLFESYTEDCFTHPTVTQIVPFVMQLLPEELQEPFARGPKRSSIVLATLIAETEKEQLHKIGLWAAPALIPYPLSRIAEKINSNDLAEARAILVAYCTASFIEQRILHKWSVIKAFHDRSDVFEEALFAHQNAKYRLAIYTLIPQIEGVISDWISGLENQKLETQFSKKIDQFFSLLKNISDEYLHFVLQLEKTLESTFEFLKDGQPMRNFKNWFDIIDPSFPGRHPVAHGKYSDDMFTEENSIKLFLFLDTIWNFMIYYEVAILRRDFSK